MSGLGKLPALIVVDPLGVVQLAVLFAGKGKITRCIPAGEVLNSLTGIDTGAKVKHNIDCARQVRDLLRDKFQVSKDAGWQERITAYVGTN